MTFEYDAPEKLEGDSSLLSEPGTYHLTVMGIFEGLMPDGKTILTGGGFSVNLSVLAGTVAGQEEKLLNLIFGNPKIDATDKAKQMAASKKGAFFVATDLMTPAQLGQRGLKIELEKSVGRQLIATLEPDNREGKEKFLQVSYACIYHVDDPRAAKFPRSQEALAIMSKALRHDAAYFAPLTEKKAGGTPAAPTRTPQLTTAQLADL